jgi:hypothetical protein
MHVQMSYAVGVFRQKRGDESIHVPLFAVF